ncbi:hypothetical protein C0995_004350, partial [Termitomyces sp. Mi166
MPSTKRVLDTQQPSCWDKFFMALKVGFGPDAQHRKELSGPLVLFYHVEKLIPRMVNSFLELNAIFMHGLVAEGLLYVLYLGPDEENGAAETDGLCLSKGPTCTSQIHLKAFYTILKLEPHIKFVKGAMSAQTADTYKVKDDLIWLMHDSAL